MASVICCHIWQVDLHGHSKKRSVFLYGNCSGAPTQAHRLAERMLPWLMGQASDGAFSYDNCKFRIEPGKECTARVAVAQQLKVAHLPRKTRPAAEPNPERHTNPERHRPGRPP